jgi:hypothetical protein
MWFLIEYDREAGRMVTFRRFPEDERDEANRVRLDLELQQLDQSKQTHEIVVLEAATEEALRRTHRRYFEHWPCR